jgi:hypothetical protein
VTGRELITASLRLIGALAPGEAMQSTEASEGLATLNRMIDSWSNENLLIYSKVREELTLTPSDGSYTMGSSGNLNTTRAIKIESATIENQSSSPMTETALRIIRTAAEWAGITSKESTSEIPEYLFLEGTYPLETMNLYPVPTYAHKLVLYSQKPITQVSTLDTSVSLPQGYDEALTYNLAIRLSPEYGRPVSQEVAMIATESKAAIKRTNIRPSLLRCDSAVAAVGRFNIYTGDYE